MLERWEAGFKPFDTSFRVLFNSYYNAVGDKHPRPQRGVLTRPSLDMVLAYLANIDQRVIQLFDSAWQWTSSSYAAYPGFRVKPGAVGEYNDKFMVNQYVLRGGSVVTPSGHNRATYRNFFQTRACWQFSGIRLARDA